jgi:hypothetical protein
MSLPRVLLVPQLTQLEWGIKPQLERWAEVATYDAPGVGNEPPPPHFVREAVVERGLSELERRGWDRCVVVGDEFGVATAILIAHAQPEAIEGLALGHACLSYEREGERASLNSGVHDAMRRVLDSDYRTFVRHLTQITKGDYDDELVELFMARVPEPIAHAYADEAGAHTRSFGELLSALDVPLLLVEHEGCLRFTQQGYEDAVAAFPGAMTASTPIKPSMSAEFGEALRAFCTRVSAREANVPESAG